MAGLLILIVLLGLYFLPTIVAVNRKHPNAGAIAALNFLAGWTFVGWVGAMVWSMTTQQPAVQFNNFQGGAPMPPPIYYGQVPPGQLPSGPLRPGQLHQGQLHQGQPFPGQNHQGQPFPGQNYPGPNYQGQPFPAQQPQPLPTQPLPASQPPQGPAER
ncbi:superinfection immunity protein [Kineosporia babensis]|uniref:Superinfection immunity protein n=1 Tax=Kineosporia babensis TaxID=499548 RepID=A0A9X1NIP9_9ACTN|nr:superinfection immunity protein [Kineosporia babensis]MCD5314795.1 superinfection immunity protein [Kineosporia babensis]